MDNVLRLLLAAALAAAVIAAMFWFENREEGDEPVPAPVKARTLR
jgi:hypothetical protein